MKQKTPHKKKGGRGKGTLSSSAVQDASLFVLNEKGMNVLFGKTKQTNAHNGLRHTYTGETAVHTLNTDLYITIIVDFRTRRYGYGYLDVVAPLLVLLDIRTQEKQQYIL